MSGHERDPEARIIYAMCIVLTVPVIVIAFVRGEEIGAGASLCMLVAVLGVIGLIVDWRKRTKLPRARVVRAPAPRDPSPRLRDHPIAHDTVLVIEDEPSIRLFLRTTLAGHGLHMVEASTLAEGRRALEDARPAVVLLDLGLPDGDGLQLLQTLRVTSRTPVIVLSARDRELDKITALDAGADDYLLKPFDSHALLARVQTALQRARSPLAPSDVIVAGPFRIDLQDGTVSVEGDAMTLTRPELRLLAALAREPGKVLTYRQLIDALWGGESVHGTSDLRVQVAALRRKIEKEPARPRWLLAETGVGYRLRVDHSDDGSASRSL
jgi:two-component system, OmpR family, KDP operon response regulator KdpE